MPDIKIRAVDENTLKLLDDIVSQEKLPSRNYLINHILNTYVVNRHNYITSILPETTKCLMDEQLQRQQEASEAALNLIYNVNVKVLAELEKIQSLFLPDISENE